MRSMSKRMGGMGGLGGIGESKAKVYMEKSTGVTFADVAGQDEAKETLREIVDFLLLQVINRFQPLFAHLQRLPVLHPPASSLTRKERGVPSVPSVPGL